MSLKKNIAILGIGGAGGLLATVVFLAFAPKIGFLDLNTGANNGTAVVYSQSINEKKYAPTNNSPILSGDFSSVIENFKNRVIAIQSFSRGKLIASGSGVIVTQDGLIITVNAIIPNTTDAIQISKNGTILRGKLVSRNKTFDLAIIAVADTKGVLTEIAGLRKELPRLGEEIAIISQIINLGSEETNALKTSVNRIQQTESTFEAPILYNNQIFGAAVVDANGELLGLLNFKNNRPTIISAGPIADFLSEYFASDK